MKPKVFISYSWSSQSHQKLIIEWAERLINDGVDVVLDVYDLQEGDDKYAFMERMVNDESVTHVLIFSDKTYAQKADSRKSGVGTESQIISKEIYERIKQSKFIPIVCEFCDDGEPYLPTFLKSRIWVDFSSPESVNKNWERLIRLLYGKPIYEKPSLGTPPPYIQESHSTPRSPAVIRFQTFRQAILDDKKGIKIYRKDFLDTCINFADSLRVRERPEVDSLGKKILEDCRQLSTVRNLIIDWVLLESEITPSSEFSETLIRFLERLLELKSRPPELNTWSDVWFEAHSIFVYETFLYIIAALLKKEAFDVLHDIFTSYYLLPKTEAYRENRFVCFDAFYGYSRTLNEVLAPEGRRLISPAAELIKRQSDRNDITFQDVIEAELLILLNAFIHPTAQWYPQTFHYASYAHEFSFFIRATQHKYFKNLGKITGIDNADKLRELVKKGHERLNVSQWHDFFWVRETFWSAMNMDKLDTLK